MSFSVVPRLEDIAFVVSLDDIVSKLLACHDYQPGEKRPAEVLDSAHNLLHPTVSKEHVINGIRNSLSYHLIGRVGVKVRQRYWKYYSNEEFLSRYKKNVPHPWMVLDCVLDESFKKFDEPIIPLDMALNENDAKVIPTIAHRSSQLEKLKISFKHTTFPMAALKKCDRLIQSLSSLSHLTSLTIVDLPKPRRSVLKFVGKSCPLLSTFRLLGRFEAVNRDIVALLLGERAYEFFPNDDLSTEDEIKLEEFMMPKEILTPMCSTLQSLYLIENEFEGDIESGLVFALRHLPKLRKVGGTKCLLEAIELLYESLEDEDEDVEEQIANSSPNNFPERTLSLTKIHAISVVSTEEDVFQLIGEKCPNLKEISFDERYISGRVPKHISQQSLENVLNGCPKLDSIIFDEVDRQLVKPILKIFGPSLQHLTFRDCYNVDLSSLLPCTRLKSLRIIRNRYSTKLLKENPPPNLKANEFLPQLKIIDIQTCLGHWSRFFEGNSELTSVSITCCHIGTEASIYPDCNNIPEIWPHLEKLSITTKCSDKGFTIPMISAVIPQLPNLKEISFPNHLEPKSSLYLCRCFWESSPLFVNFAHINCNSVCSFLP